MPLVQTRGAASAQGFGEFAQVTAVNYIENVFSVYPYSGNSTNRSIVNDINLSGKGGLVWIKDRNVGLNHTLFDTARGATNYLFSDNTNAQGSAGNTLTAFNSTGFDLGTNSGYVNGSGYDFVSWTFRKQPKFFDIVTYTGNGAGNQVVAHNLGSEPGCIFAKKTSSTSNWIVYHRGLSGGENIRLNTTGSAAAFGSPDPLSLNGPASFNVGAGPTADDNLNDSGQTYIAYLFAHDAGGFGLTGLDNVISCASYTYVSGTLSVNLGYEPQWVMIKQTDGAGSWFINDTARNWRADNSTAGTRTLYAQSANAEGTGGADWNITSTGFTVTSGTGTFIYIACRRGPMKVPTLGTTVFEPVTSTSTNDVNGTLQAFDMGFFKDRNTAANNFITDRLRGFANPSSYSPTLYTNLTDAEATPTTGDTVYSIISGANKPNGQGYFGGAGTVTNQPLGYSFKRAPSFFDEVCYTGTGTHVQSINHNLGVPVELAIIKSRSAVQNWAVWVTPNMSRWGLNTTDLASTGWPNSNNTSSTFCVADVAGSSSSPNGADTINVTFVAYLFATCAGVSKVGSYAGTGATQTVDCGFGAGGARFVLIKRSDSTGDWYVWDSARGMISGTDPSLLLNSTATEVNANSVYAISTGFQIVSTAAGINSSASGATYIFLAIA